MTQVLNEATSIYTHNEFYRGARLNYLAYRRWQQHLR
jgi:hypothetical protein